MAASYLPSIEDTEPELTTRHTRIQITTRKRRVTSLRKPARIQEAIDFWSFAGGAANVVMQLGWPEVAYGVMESKVESGALTKHPWKRARTTGQYLAVAILGTDEEKAAFREAVNSAHRHVKSDANSPVKYNAFNRELQMWVAACLFVGIEDMHLLLHGIMTDEEAEEFYQSAKTLGTTLQVPDEMWPATRKDFDRYWNLGCQRIVIDDTTCDFLNDLVDLKMINPLIRLPFVNLLRFLTIGSLPPIYRDQLGLEWTEDDRRRFQHLFTFVSVVNKFLPKSIRFGGSRMLMRDLRRRMKHDKAII
ncbi:oxygenase MpaB family protein [Gordonia westfalica]|uniref:Oxygenase MpaB family protein n=1 Tax=Gordonia westfalica TaxID=158898 RepID=A0ABU2GWW4_9ACTN|nr:oxygenase MpaB family protein [Gordonia westfalica]MDS1115957.1 oxygenase MpaB family protein [Gordonia westfalica]